MNKKHLVLLAAACCLALALPVLAQDSATPAPSGAMPDTAAAGAEVATPINPLNVTADEATGFVRFAHAAADVPSVDIYVSEMGDTPLVSNLAFGEVTDLVMLPSNPTYTVSVYPAGASMADTQPVTSMDVDILQDTTTLLSVVGLMETVSVQVEPVLLLRDNIDADMARVRVINYVSGADPVSITSDRGETFGEGLGWIGIYDADVEPGTVNLSLSDADGTTLTTDSLVDLEAGKHTTILLTGGADGQPPVEFVTFTDEADTANVSFVNNTGAAVDIFVRTDQDQPSDTLVSSLAAGETSDQIVVPAGAVTFITYAPGTGPEGQELAAWIGTVHPGRQLSITFEADGTASESEVQFSELMMVEAAG